MGLVTTLGYGLDANLRGLNRQKASIGRKTLNQLVEPSEVPYLSVSSAIESKSERLFDLLDAAVEEALRQAVINNDVREQMPVYIGSSSYNIGLAEESYQEALATQLAPQLAPQDMGGAQANKQQVTDHITAPVTDIAPVPPLSARPASAAPTSAMLTPAVPMPVDGFSAISRRLRQKYGLRGADFSINTACTSSANALLGASRSISSGQSDYALVIGIEAFNFTTLSGFAGMQLLAHDEMRPFDQGRNGMVLGEGCSALLLKLAHRQEAGISIVGGASGCDTYNISAANPDGSSLAGLMQTALDDATVSTADIKAIKAHGTASRLSDACEAAGMRLAFPELPPFFVLKPYVGHTLGGSGAIETALLAISLGQGFLPGTPGFEVADDSLGLVPVTRSVSAVKGYYMLNFFGFGGNHNSLILHYQ